jgi:hypothetical protein
MHDQQGQSVPHLAPNTFPHALDFLSEIFGVDVRQFSIPQEAGLLLRPGKEIIVVSDRIAGHLRFLHHHQLV